MEKSRSVKLNIISMFIYQGVGILSGFIMPRLILATFGSEVNGLTSSLSQFLSYITLFEGGVSTVFTSCLYAPLQADDKQKISAIIRSSNLFFNKLVPYKELYQKNKLFFSFCCYYIHSCNNLLFGNNNQMMAQSPLLNHEQQAKLL